MNWSDWVSALTARRCASIAEADTALVLAVAGLFARPAADLLGAAPARLAVGLAVAELHDSGEAGDGAQTGTGPIQAAGAARGDEAAHLLRWAEAGLTKALPRSRDPLAVGRAALYVREALDALRDG